MDYLLLLQVLLLYLLLLHSLLLRNHLLLLRISGYHCLLLNDGRDLTNVTHSVLTSLNLRIVGSGVLIITTLNKLRKQHCIVLLIICRVNIVLLRGHVTAEEKIRSLKTAKTSVIGNLLTIAVVVAAEHTAVVAAEDNKPFAWDRNTHTLR